MKKVLVIAFIFCFIFLLKGWDDEELFYNTVKPNILFLLDSSGSMRNVIYHPDYIPGDGTGTCENTGDLDGMYDNWGETKYVARWSDGTNAYVTPDSVSFWETGAYERVLDGTQYRYRLGSSGSNFQVGDTTLLYSPNSSESEGWAVISDIQNIGGNDWAFLSNVHGGELDSTSNELGRFVAAGWDNMRFCVCRDAGHTAITIKFWGGIDKKDTTQTASYQFNGAGDVDDYFEWAFNNTTSEQKDQISHFADYGTFDLSDTTVHQNAYTRISVAREALMGITDHVKFNDKVRIGLMEFDGGDGGWLAYYDGEYGTIKDIEDAGNKQALIDIMDNMRGNGSTPLGEALAETWRYFAGDSPFYTNRTGSGGSTYDSPCDLWCRKNFVIILSDGEPNSDDRFFTVPEGNIHQVYDTEPVGWSGPDWDVVNVAKYIYNYDTRPDMDEAQNINVYTIGFTTSGLTNQLLQAVADHGSSELPGEGFFQANDYETLIERFAEILGKIMENLSSFSSFSAPKHSLTSGLRGYIATFIPRSNKARWQGFLKAYDLNSNGDFEVDPSGEPINHIWDVAELLEGRTYNGGPGGFGSSAGINQRTIFTYFDGGVQHFYDGNAAITHTMLGVAPADDAGRTAIIEVVRGKENPYNYNNKFGDVFHFDPKISIPPLEIDVLFNSSLYDFWDTYKDRDEVVLVGANDGMFHCFRVTDGAELWSFIPPSSLGRLQNIGLNLCHDYFVDGQGLVKNIQVDNNGGDDDWQTLTVFGQGLGGESYYGLDVTDPTDPKYKWEIGNETFDNGDLGKTILKNGSTTIISDESLFGNTMDMAACGSIAYKANPSDEITYAIVIALGFDQEELTPLSTDGNSKGKGLFILDSDTGEIIKSFRYGSNSNSSGSWSSSDFLYSMAAAPVLVDYNNDGFYDCIYQADIGGRLWKIDISSTNRINWEPYIIFDTDGTIDEGISSQPIFISPTVGYGSEYNVWIFMGTGYRANPNDQSEIGHFYVFMDNFTPSSTPFTPDDLQDITSTLSGNHNNVDTDKDGYPDTQEIALGTDPNDPYDYPIGVPSTGSISVTDPDGFYFQFIHDTYNGEKLFSPAPIYIGGYLFFNTYVPPDGSESSGDETCDPAGDLYVYSFKFSVVNGTITLESPSVTKGRILGSGLLSGSEYKIYIGDGEIGSQKLPPGKQPKIGLTDSFGILFWKENKYNVYE